MLTAAYTGVTEVDSGFPRSLEIPDGCGEAPVHVVAASIERAVRLTGDYLAKEGRIAT